MLDTWEGGRDSDLHVGSSCWALGREAGIVGFSCWKVGRG